MNGSKIPYSQLNQLVKKAAKGTMSMSRRKNSVKQVSLPFTPIGRTISQIAILLSEEVEANIPIFSDNIIPVRHVTPFLCISGICKACLHCKIKWEILNKFITEVKSE